MEVPFGQQNILGMNFKSFLSNFGELYIFLRKETLVELPTEAPLSDETHFFHFSRFL